jgi:hypothetical protein
MLGLPTDVCAERLVHVTEQLLQHEAADARVPASIVVRINTASNMIAK